MIKTNPKSYFAHKNLDEIQSFNGVVLQAEKTESTYTGTKKAVYLCELVSYRDHSRTSMQDLTSEIIRLNADNRKLYNRIFKLQRKIDAMEGK